MDEKQVQNLPKKQKLETCSGVSTDEEEENIDAVDLENNSSHPLLLGQECYICGYVPCFGFPITHYRCGHVACYLCSKVLWCEECEIYQDSVDQQKMHFGEDLGICVEIWVKIFKYIDHLKNTMLSVGFTCKFFREIMNKHFPAFHFLNRNESSLGISRLDFLDVYTFYLIYQRIPYHIFTSNFNSIELTLNVTLLKMKSEIKKYSILRQLKLIEEQIIMIILILESKHHIEIESIHGQPMLHYFRTRTNHKICRFCH